MIRVFRNAIIGIILIIPLILLSLPTMLTFFRLHPEYKEEVFALNDKRALIIATNHGVLNKPNETNGKATGLFLSELLLILCQDMKLLQYQLPPRQFH